eukprot:1157574-Pelagomonas_calceolata.AAC.18
MSIKPRSSQDSGTYVRSPSPVDGGMLLPEGSTDRQPWMPPPGVELGEGQQDEHTQEEPSENQQGGPVYEWSDDSYAVDASPAPSALKKSTSSTPTGSYLRSGRLASALCAPAKAAAVLV